MFNDIITWPTQDDPYWTSVKLLLQNQSNSTVDSSTAGTPLVQYTWPGTGSGTGSANSVAVPVTLNGPNPSAPTAASFNGHSYLSTTTALIFAGNFTMEGWLYWTNTGSAAQILWAYRTANNPQPFGVLINANSDSKLQMFFNSSFVTSTIVMPQNQWAHVAACRNGSTISLYIDGVLAAPTITSAVTIGPGALGVGYYTFNYTAFDSPFQGYMSNLRFTQGVCRYTANFTPPVPPFPVQP